MIIYYKIIISFLEYVSENLLNILVYYVYYWIEFKPENKEVYIELINN